VRRQVPSLERRVLGPRAWLLAALGAGATFCSAIGASPARAAALPLHECRLTSSAGVGSIEARCGLFEVAENRSDPQSRKVGLHVAVIPALRLEPAADPLFILSGGPGQAASDFYISLSPAFARIRRDRDIVLVDQRGTGRSNRLDCKFPDEGDFTLVDPAQLRATMQACIAALPGDPRFYTTSVAVRDLDEVRAALGYRSINLYGVSYGTRVAQHYLRRYPDRVRAAILDGVVPPALALGPDVAIEAQRALDRTFARCVADQRCAQAFPDLERTFQQLRARLQSQPENLSIADPMTAEPTLTTLGLPQLTAAVRLLSYSDETTSILPLLIHQAQAARQPQALAAQYLMIKRSADQQIAYGMHFSVVCSEDAPRWSSEPVTEAQLAQTYMGTEFMQGMKTICELWPRGPVDADFATPLESPAPVLVLSGDNDPVTPARYGEQILPGLPNARHLVLSGQGHGQIATGCVPRLAAEFIASGSAAGIDTSCATLIGPAPFMLSRTASEP
jgi:pimeloyl-ACP methyl ester carboxylesterase